MDRSLRFATDTDREQVRPLLKASFGWSDALADHYLTPDPARKMLCCIDGGFPVAALSGFQLDYVSAEYDTPCHPEQEMSRLATLARHDSELCHPERSRGIYHKYWHGFYLYGLWVAPGHDAGSLAAALIETWAAAAAAEGRDFLLLRPFQSPYLTADSCKSLGFSLELTRPGGLPSIEEPEGIAGLRASELFLKRHRSLGSNYFQWSPPLLHYILKHCKFAAERDLSNSLEMTSGPSPGEAPRAESITPWALIRPVNPAFCLSSPAAVFSYPLD